MNRTTSTKARGGCSGLGVLFIFLALGAIVSWPTYVNTRGESTPGRITEKRETIRTSYGDWSRRFEVIAAYEVPGHPIQRLASCAVDEKTYDSLHRGEQVTVHYIPNLLDQPFIPPTRLSPCSSVAALSFNPVTLHSLELAFGSLAVILILWRLFRVRIAGWLLVPWLCYFAAALMLPHTEPVPSQPVAATATVDDITTVTRIGQSSHEKGIDMLHPYQMVRLKFVPSGMDTPVLAMDKIDAGSIPNLQTGQVVSVTYDAAHPRVVRLQQGTRSFPGQAMLVVILCGASILVFLAIVAASGVFFRMLGRIPFIRAARASAALRRQARRSR